MIAPVRATRPHSVEETPLLRADRARRLDAGARERWAEVVSDRLDRPMSVLGVLFLLVVLAQTLASARPLQTALAAAGWVLWAVFVAEFAVRLWVAPSRRRFLRRNWWQLIFLAVPFLRFVRLVLVLRLARAGRVVSSAVRSSRSARRILSDRLGWLAAVSAIVVLAASQVLFVFDVFDSYGAALHAAALLTITGEPLGRDEALAKVLDVVLAAYSVAVFAVLAGTLGAYFLQGRRGSEPARAPG